MFGFERHFLIGKSSFFVVPDLQIYEIYYNFYYHILYTSITYIFYKSSFPVIVANTW